MNKRLILDLRRIMAFILVASMVFCTDAMWGIEDAFAKEINAENVAGIEGAAPAIEDSDADDENSDADDSVSDNADADNENSDADDSVSDNAGSENSADESFETVSSQAVSDNQVDTVSDDEVSENQINSDGDEERIYIADENLVKWLVQLYSSDLKLVDGKIVTVETNPQFKTIDDPESFGYLDKSVADTVTSLEFDFGNTDVFNGYMTTKMADNVDFTELSKFENLQNLTIKGTYKNDNLRIKDLYKNEDGTYKYTENDPTVRTNVSPEYYPTIEMPSSLTSLTIDGCVFLCRLDLSKCANLETFNFTNNTFFWADNNNSYAERASGIIYSSGENVAGALTSVDFSGYSLTKIELPGSSTSDGLSFTATKCAKLTSINTGDYKITDLNVTKCEKLTSLEMKEKVKSTEQLIDVSECFALTNFKISCSFEDKNYLLKIVAKGIVAPEGVFSLEVPTGVLGKIQLSAPNTSYIMVWAKKHSSLFSELIAAATSAKYVLFDEQYQNFKIRKRGHGNTIEQAVAKRDLVNQPIMLYKGQSIKCNIPHFYAEDGTLLPDVKYSYTITNNTAPDGYPSVPSVISETNSTNRTVHADNPGIATVTVKALDGSNCEAVQKIIVMPPITSITISNDGADFMNGEGTAGFSQYRFSAIMHVDDNYKYLTKYAYGDCDFKLEYKDLEGNWINVSSSAIFDDRTIKVGEASQTKSRDEQSGDITVGAMVTVYKKCPSLQFRVTGNVTDNYDTDGSTFIKTPDGNYYKFAVLKAEASNNNLGYGYDRAEGYDPGNPSSSFSTISSAVDIIAPDLGSEYAVSAARIVDEDKYKGCLKLTKVEDRKYRLSFNTEKTTKEVANMLKPLDLQGNCKVFVEYEYTRVDKGATGTTGQTINLSGYFPINYNLNGGTMSRYDNKYYLIPFVGDTTLNTKPTKPGCTFAGWYLKGQKTRYFSLEGDCDLEARWYETKPNVQAVYNNIPLAITTNSDGTATITKVSDNKSKSITLSNSVNIDGIDYKFSTLAAKALSGTKAKTLILGEGITKINKNAFAGSKVKTLNLLSANVTFDKGAFKKSKITNVKIPKSLSKNKKAYKAFVKKLKKAGYSGKVNNKKI